MLVQQAQDCKVRQERMALMVLLSRAHKAQLELMEFKAQLGLMERQ